MSVEMLVLKNREEWLKNRFNGVGGSEISAVVGCNPYLDNITLWEIKQSLTVCRIYRQSIILLSVQTLKLTSVI